MRADDEWMMRVCRLLMMMRVCVCVTDKVERSMRSRVRVCVFTIYIHIACVE